MRGKSKIVAALLVAGLIGSGFAAAPADGGEAAGCPAVITAKNTGNRSIYVMLYSSRVRAANTLYPWRRLKVQNHRVGPGKEMSRNVSLRGGCNARREWRFYLKKGSNQNTVRKISSEDNYVHRVSLGDLKRYF